jgi:hypothetical protein
MRGAIVEGEFHVKEMCFAGRAIVDAYKLCESLDFSGLVCESQLATRLPKSLCIDPSGRTARTVLLGWT